MQSHELSTHLQLLPLAVPKINLIDMGQRRHSRESIVQTLQNIGASMATTTLTKRDVQPHLSLSAVNYHFGNLGNALTAAGLSVAVRDLSAIGKRSRLDDDVLFTGLLEVEKKIGHAPSFSEYRANGGVLSDRPFRARFGIWAKTLEHYSKWKSEGGMLLDTNRANAVDETANGQLENASLSLPASVSPIRSPRKPPQLFGEPIDFRGLRHAPINEQGVVYLFGMVSRELGFSVEALQQGFPDCEGKYLHDKNRKLWAKARIEFEFKASNFRDHGHDEKNAMSSYAGRMIGRIARCESSNSRVR